MLKAVLQSSTGDLRKLAVAGKATRAEWVTIIVKDVPVSLGRIVIELRVGSVIVQL